MRINSRLQSIDQRLCAQACAIKSIRFEWQLRLSKEHWLEKAFKIGLILQSSAASQQRWPERKA
ncbi:hypothetical protein BER92_09730 [Xanthomonas fragariae]|nr:hypothetical protein BER92_09730 [Xanthomonas fragariae]